MTVQVNPEYAGPDRVTFITLSEPSLEDIKTIPVGCDIIVFMPSGAVTEWYWDEQVRNDIVDHLTNGGTLDGHLFIYVNPDIIKEGH